MWTDLDQVLGLIGAVLGGVVVTLVLLTWLEDNLHRELPQPRGLAALRAWWRGTRDSER